MEAGEKNLKMWKKRKKVKNVIKNALSQVGNELCWGNKSIFFGWRELIRIGIVL